MTGALKKDLPSSDPLNGTGQAEEFRRLALRYSEIGADEGIRVTPFLSPEMPLFQKANYEERKNATEFLRTIVEIHEETIAGGDKAINSKKLIWRALSKLSLVPGPDVFDRLADEDIVLVYHKNQTVLFWNLQFFSFTSATVEQLFFCRWYEFTKRDPEILQRLQEMAIGVTSGKITGNFIPGIPGHEVVEVDTLESIRTWMEIPWGSVLTSKGSLGGVLLVQRMKILV